MYVLFTNDAELIAGAGRTVSARNSVQRVDQFRESVIVPGAKALSSVMRIQQSNIVAHGGNGSNAVSSNLRERRTLSERAQQLLDQKLTTSIQEVKLYCSFGGVGGVASTAKQFKDSMRAKGFSSVSVYGYTLMLDQGRLHGSHKKAYMDVDSPEVGAKSVRLRF